MTSPFLRTHRLLLASALTLALLFGIACASSSPQPLQLSDVPAADELYGDAIETLAGGHKLWLIDTTDYEKGVEALQDIIDNYPYSDYATLAELKIADAYYQQEMYDEALSYYRDFYDLHPDHERVPYAMYRSALSHFHQSKKAGRDQTATRESLARLDELMTSYPRSTEAEEGERLWRELRTRLGKHEMQVGNFYMDREEYQSAADRYRTILDEYPGLGLDAQALYKLGVCYTEMNLDDEANRIFQVILENYQGSDLAERAEELVPAAN